jgi:hypothetical protein
MTTSEQPPAEGAEDALGSVGRGVEILARRAVGGRIDAGVVLTLRAVRRLWVPALMLGLAWLIGTGDITTVRAEDLDSVGELLAAVLSPLAGLAIAFGVRILTGALGFLAAAPRARAELVADHERRAAIVARVSDLVFLTGALRSLRFTAAARDVAAGRLGAAGRVALVVDRVETWLVPVSSVVFVLVSVLAA